LRAANRGAVMGASVAEFDFGAHGGKQLARGLDVAHLRNVFQDDRFVGEQGRGHARECGVLRATDSRTVPSSGLPPRMTSLSIECVFGNQDRSHSNYDCGAAARNPA
jgi:hypothetical protein